MFYFDEEHDGWTSDAKTKLGFQFDIIWMFITVAIPFWIEGLFTGADSFGLEMHQKKREKIKSSKKKGIENP